MVEVVGREVVEVDVLTATTHSSLLPTFVGHIVKHTYTWKYRKVSFSFRLMMSIN